MPKVVTHNSGAKKNVCADDLVSRRARCLFGAQQRIGSSCGRSAQRLDRGFSATDVTEHIDDLISRRNDHTARRGDCTACSFHRTLSRDDSICDKNLSRHRRELARRGGELIVLSTEIARLLGQPTRTAAETSVRLRTLTGQYVETTMHAARTNPTARRLRTTRPRDDMT